MKIFNLVLLVIVVLVSPLASAHATLAASSPADGEQVTSAPTVLRFEFNKEVRLLKVELFDKDGEQIRLGFMLSPIMSKVFEIPLPVIEASAYTVKWMAMGGDSHKLTGAFEFVYAKLPAAENQTADQNAVQKTDKNLRPTSHSTEPVEQETDHQP
jgi:copper resistance protein C